MTRSLKHYENGAAGPVPLASRTIEGATMGKATAMPRHFALTAALIPIVIPLAGAVAQGLSPASVFEDKTTTPARSGATQQVSISVQSWELNGPKSAAHKLPLRGFYVAHLLSGDISTTIDGKTTRQVPGAYWTVKAGATMQVRVLRESAVLETIVVSKE